MMSGFPSTPTLVDHTISEIAVIFHLWNTARFRPRHKFSGHFKVLTDLIHSHVLSPQSSHRAELIKIRLAEEARIVLELSKIAEGVTIAVFVDAKRLFKCGTLEQHAVKENLRADEIEGLIDANRCAKLIGIQIF